MAVNIYNSEGIITMTANADTVTGPFWVDSIEFMAGANGTVTITDSSSGAVLFLFLPGTYERNKQTNINRKVNGLKLTLATATGTALIYLRKGGTKG